MSMHTIELDLNETGFLCNMILRSCIQAGMQDPISGELSMPTWLAGLFAKLAKANDAMMAEPVPFDQPSRLVLPN
jgi:hypothetical protein